MFENIAAIDIGTSSIKVAIVKTGFKDFQLKSFLQENIDENKENYLEALNEALTKLISEENLSSCKIITNLPMEKAIIRNVTFPFNDVQKIADAIPYEAEDNIPFKIEDLVLDFQSLKCEKKDEGRILLAATHKEAMLDFIKIFNYHKLTPIKMGMEFNSLLEYYKYFNKIGSETVIQLHIGNNKTIINLIQDNSLIYTRSISIGVNQIYKSISSILKISIADSIRFFDNLKLDLSSLANNIENGNFKSLKITKDKLKSIYISSINIINDIVEQILLTIKAYTVTGEHINFNRILISGGGTSINGLGVHISKLLEIPVVSLPFLDENIEEKFQNQIPIAFGMILSYLNKKFYSINFLKGEFIPDIVRSTKKIYYLAGFFIIMALIIFFLNIIISTILISKSNKKYNDIVSEKYKKYFNVKKSPDDPLVEANKLVKKEKNELDNIAMLASHNYSIMDLLFDMISHFSAEEIFELKDMVINERVIRIDGSIGTSKSIDDFKEKLIKSTKYESVSLNIRFSKKNEVNFTMTIKQKIDAVVEKGN